MIEGFHHVLFSSELWVPRRGAAAAAATAHHMIHSARKLDSHFAWHDSKQVLRQHDQKSQCLIKNIWSDPAPRERKKEEGRRKKVRRAKTGGTSLRVSAIGDGSGQGRKDRCRRVEAAGLAGRRSGGAGAKKQIPISQFYSPGLRGQARGRSSDRRVYASGRQPVRELEFQRFHEGNRVDFEREGCEGSGSPPLPRPLNNPAHRKTLRAHHNPARPAPCRSVAQNQRLLARQKQTSFTPGRRNPARALPTESRFRWRSCAPRNGS